MPLMSSGRHSSIRVTAVSAATALLALAGPLRAQGHEALLMVPDTVDGVLGARLDAAVRRAEALGFSGQVLVVRDGRLRLHRAYGFADRARRIPMSTRTRIGIASASKQFATASLALLAERGRLTLDDSLGRHLPGVPEDKRGITLRMLLTHTSGIRGGFTEDFDRSTLDSSLARLLRAPLAFEPGQGHRYSSDGYNLVAAVVQRVTGEPYEAFVRRELFAPAGMTRSGFWSDTTSTHRSPVAHAYVGWHDRGSPAQWPRNWRVFGSGDVLTTAGDLFRWHRALGPGGVHAERRFASLLTPAEPRAGLPDDTYAYGAFFTTDTTVGRTVEHAGDTELGFNAVVLRSVGRSDVLIVVSNARDAHGNSQRQQLQGHLAALLADSSAPPEGAPAKHTGSPPLTGLVDPGIGVMLAGSYAFGDSGRLHLVWDGAQLWAAAEGQALLALIGTLQAGESAARAAERTSRLLEGLLAGDLAAYDTALTAAGREFLPDYVAEWRSLVATEGPLHSYRLLGVAGDSSTPVAFVKLELLRGARTMSFRWLDHGRGRLSGTDPAAPAFPVTLPVALQTGGRLRAEHPLRPGIHVDIVPVEGRRLELGRAGHTLRSAAVTRAGWSPP